MIETFFNDIGQYIQGYYSGLVAITPKLILAVIVILISWFIASKVKVFANSKLQHRMHDPLLATFIANLLKMVCIICGVLLMFQIVGLTGIAGTVLAGAGISAFIIGFALKDIGENFLAGILLAFKRPFTIGDIIESNGVKGKVIALNLRDTQIKSDGRDIYIPNALLMKSTLINFNSGGYLLQEFFIGLEYGTDYDKALVVINQVLGDVAEVSNEDYHNSVVISGINTSVVQLSIRYWVKTDLLVTDGQTRSKVIKKILEELKNNAFDIK